MLVYSTVHNQNSELFLIKYLRNNKYLWDHKFFFDQLSKRQTAVLLKSLIKRSEKIIFVCLEGRQHSKKYWRPYSLGKVCFAHMDLPNAIFYNQFFDDEGRERGKTYHGRYTKDLKLKEKVCFISSNYSKLENFMRSEPNIYSELDIYGEYHSRIPGKWHEDRSGDSLATCAKYMAALCIENNDEEGYFQGSALWALYALTPPILLAPPKWRNFIKEQFVIDFQSYKAMNKKERYSAINKVQERLYSGETWLTSLSQDYIAFFKESFLQDVNPDFSKIIIKSKLYREKFIKT